jgi:hypothetical protein
MRGKIFISAVFGVSLAWAMALPARADITLDSSSLHVQASDGQGSLVNFGTNPASLPYFNDAHDALDGQAFSRSDYDFSASGDTGAFHFDFDHARTDVSTSFAEGFGQIEITSTNDVLYSLDGFYSLTGSQRLIMSVTLLDVTNGITVFSSLQESWATSNESFTLGGQGGDFTNDLIGDLSGTLLAGHEYRLGYRYLLQRIGTGPGATAVGDLNFNITPIPAPGAAVLAMVGLPIISWLKRRQTHCQPS